MTPGALFRIMLAGLASWLVIAAVTGWWWIAKAIGVLFVFGAVMLYLEGRLVARDLRRAEELRAERARERTAS